jgi:hypothetical protein
MDGKPAVPASYDSSVLSPNGFPKRVIGRKPSLFKSGEKWPDSQRKRAKILFESYPGMEKACSLSRSLRMIFNRRSVKDSA